MSMRAQDFLALPTWRKLKKMQQMVSDVGNGHVIMDADAFRIFVSSFDQVIAEAKALERGYDLQDVRGNVVPRVTQEHLSTGNVLLFPVVARINRDAASTGDGGDAA